MGKNNFKDDEISPCPGCMCMTHSIRKGRAHYVCGKCGHDKSLCDAIFFMHDMEIKLDDENKAKNLCEKKLCISMAEARRIVASGKYDAVIRKRK